MIWGVVVAKDIVLVSVRISRLSFNHLTPWSLNKTQTTFSNAFLALNEIYCSSIIISTQFAPSSLNSLIVSRRTGANFTVWISNYIHHKVWYEITYSFTSYFIGHAVSFIHAGI